MNSENQLSDKLESKTCCVTGHRDIPGEQVGYVRQELRREVERAIEDGYQHFLTDFMEGTDQLFAEVVAEIRQVNDGIRLEAVLPYRGRFEKLHKDERTRLLLAACTEVGFANEKYTKNCITVCRREQLRRSSRMIAVFDGREKGGAVTAIRMAHARKIRVCVIELGLK